MSADSFAFGVFGDGPYYPAERRRFKRVLEDVNRADVQWLIHIGDMLWYPCSDQAFDDRLEDFNSLNHPVIYTPGDNEWTNAHEELPGSFDPLDRLASIRRIFFGERGRSLGRRRLELECQGGPSAFAEFVENARWTHGGFVFATIHLVGSNNGLDKFPGRTPEHDAEVERRMQAAIHWLDGTFSRARELSAKGVVLATHADIGIDRELEPKKGYDPFVERLERNVADFPGPVLLIHGDSHTNCVDHPLKDASGGAYDNFTRLQTFGSPEIGWVRVVVDMGASRITRFEPRLMREWG